MATDKYFNICLDAPSGSCNNCAEFTDSMNVFMLFAQMHARHKVSLLEDGLGISRVMLMQQQQVQQPQDTAPPQVCCWV